MKNKVKVRFAPSPTGPLHVGSARTALFNFLYAKKLGGEIILRIDDTDKDRSKKEFEENILEGLKWLNLDYDETFHQSQRNEIYSAQIQKMIDSGAAYISKEEPKTEGSRSKVIRFKNPNVDITFTDLIRGEVKFNTADLGDFVIAKDLQTPLYHLTSVVDDIEMKITHVIRGEDHISNTPRQILMIEALDADRPEYAHIPLILAPDRSKLSKRHGATSVLEYRNMGYLPEAFVNFIALLGWSPQASTNEKEGSDEEILSMPELIEKFSLEAIKKGGAIFNIEKLNWVNRQHLLKKPPEEIYQTIKKYLPENADQEIVKKVMPLILERISVLGEAEDVIKNEFDFFFKPPKLSKDMLGSTDYMEESIEMIKKIDDSQFNAEKIKEAIWDFATEKGRKEVLWPIRVALTGKERSPDPFTCASVLGKSETIKRLETALNL